MNPRISPYFALLLGFLCGCPQVWPDFVTCEEQNACGTTEPASTDGGGTPTTSDGADTVTGSGDSSSSTTDPESSTADLESGAESVGATTDEPAELPVILTRTVDPNYTDVNAILDVLVTADHADGVQMELENGDVVELTPLGAGEFGGEILAFTGLDNGQKTAWFKPWRDALTGETVGADYVIALPPPGYEVAWQVDLNLDGDVAAIDVLPDGRPVEFGTFHEMGEPRCYLRLRDQSGAPVQFVDVLPPAHCRAIDFKIDRTTGVMHLLLERKSGDGLVWWAGESAAWGVAPKNIGIGEVGERRRNAVCFSDLSSETRQAFVVRILASAAREEEQARVRLRRCCHGERTVRVGLAADCAGPYRGIED